MEKGYEWGKSNLVQGYFPGWNLQGGVIVIPSTATIATSFDRWQWTETCPIAFFLYTHWNWAKHSFYKTNQFYYSYQVCCSQITSYHRLHLTDIAYTTRLHLELKCFITCVLVTICLDCIYAFCMFIIFHICQLSLINSIYYSHSLSVHAITSLYICEIWARARPSLHLSLFGHFRISGIWDFICFLFSWISSCCPNLHCH